MYVQVVVETPQNLTKKQRELLSEFEKLSSEDTQPESAGFFARGQGVLRHGWQPGRPSDRPTLDPPPRGPIPMTVIGP